MQQEINPKGAVACLILILPQVIGLQWDNTAASDFLNTAANDWNILPQVMGYPSWPILQKEPLHEQSRTGSSSLACQRFVSGRPCQEFAAAALCMNSFRE